MKKTLLFLFLFLGYFTAEAQFDCATDAVEIMDNGIISTPNTIDGNYAIGCFNDTVDSNGDPIYGIWYTFTPDTNGEVKINSNLPQNVTLNIDSRLSVFTGDCSNLVCYKSNDDTSTSVYLSTLTFPVLAGVTYYIQWDSYWDNSGPDFDFTFTPISCLKIYTINQPSNLTDTSATLNWDASLSNPASYQVEYGVTGFTQGTGTIVTSDTNSIVISGLVTGTIYDYYIRTACDASTFSDWSAVNTLTMAKSCPYYSGFDSDAEFAGWTTSGNGNGAYGQGTISSQAQSPSKFWIFNTGTTGDADNWLYSPPLVLQAGEAVTVSFWTRCLTTRNLRLTVGTDNTAVAQTSTIWSNTSLLNTTYTQTSAPVWTAPQAGVYYFAFNDKSAAAATATLRLDTVTFSSTILDVKNNSSVKLLVYPNPVEAILNISGDTANEINSIEIIDINGRFIKQIKTEGTAQESVSVADLANGIYFLRISTNQGTVVKKISKD
ncbi:T9SS-dependent choice-of-anchor J family protein [Flavobacterium phycosphaerae]|uniref:T9SS-dependent choice-of-anchor J family protein n=1 Tax=Flavobacterium phycosphaerae TaxID=2697515 RepID=UPI0013893FB3|nr:T9SS type A sorting domain-containing protein [Flavobacterium phycosphaerae]